MPEPRLPPPSTAAVCLAGALSLAVAMGIGRFAFTPLLPLMMRDALLDAPAGAAMAAANYLGYLLGALSAARVAGDPLRLVRGCLVATAILTAGIGVVDDRTVWLVMRFATGVCSAWTLVGISAWAMGELALRGESARGALVFTGVGAGIVLTGGHVWLAAQQPSPALWRQLGALAALLGALVFVLLHRARWHAAAPADRSGTVPRSAWALVICYGLFGFGYSLPVTFLPAQARALIDDPRVFGLAWPAFGLVALLSTLLSARALSRWRGQRLWAVGQVSIGLGTALPSLARGGWAIALSALLVGGSFMVVTMVGLQQARALSPQRPAGVLGRMTAAFALGQMGGPLVVRAIGEGHWAGLDAIDLTALPAAALLGLSGWWLWRRDARTMRVAATTGATDRR